MIINIIKSSAVIDFFELLFTKITFLEPYINLYKYIFEPYINLYKLFFSW